MLRWAVSACFALVLVLNAPSGARAQNVEGTWKLNYVLNGLDNAMAIVKLTPKDGKVSGELVAASPRMLNLAFKSISQDGATLKITLTNGNFEFVYEAIVSTGAPKKLNASMAQGANFYPATLTRTDETEIDVKSAAKPLDCPPLAELRILTDRVANLRNKALKSKDAAEKKTLQQQAADADRIVKQQTPLLYRDVLEKHADSPAALDASLGLLRSAQASEAKADQVKAWANAGATAAKTYGPGFEANFASQIASVLLGQDAYAKLAIGYARQAEKTLTDKAAPGEQVRILSIVVRALKANGQDVEAKAYDVRLVKLETELDREYMTKMPPFKGSQFAGRTSKSDKAAFMELFTGATCPPCVAADLAFDVLQKTYKPTDLVLIQYHVHIPGPDPMTNLDTVARWEYYRKAYPGKVGGVPSSIFNGTPQGGGGGGVGNAEKKYEAYCKIIDPLLEVDAGAKVIASAVRKGDRVDINVSVENLKEPGTDKILRILLAEETVRYPGSNSIRLHHNVVRAFPGGVEGTALTAAASKHNASIDLGELRTNLNKYLSNYEATVRPFANPARPLEFANLRVIAIVQDDTTHEILQAVQIPVAAK